MVRSLSLLMAFCASALLAGCSSAPHEPALLSVPGDFATIQEAVNAAREGDTVLIEPGTYAESVRVESADITIRGRDRNSVVLDGGHKLSTGFYVVADGVAIENLTVHSFTQNGVIFTGTGANGHADDYNAPPDYHEGEPLPHLERFRISYVTVYNNGLYGMYAFQSRNGVIENSYASGHPDSGIYVGQCDPCNTVVDSVLLENNAIGYYGTNASGKVYVVRSVMQGNRLGITPNSQHEELLAPQNETYVVGNIVADNDNPDTPPIDRGFYGGGIAVGGGIGNVVARNLVTGNDVYGIGLVTLNPFDPDANVVTGNVLYDNGLDLIYAPSNLVETANGNCFADNDFTTSYPADIETVLPCPGASAPVPWQQVRYPRAPLGLDYRDMLAPAPQPTMPGDVTALHVMLPATPVYPDIDAIPVPTR